MDDCRFENWMRIVAGKSDRRTAVMGLAGGVAAPLTLARAELGIAQGSDVALEADCRVNGGNAEEMVTAALAVAAPTASATRNSRPQP